MEQDARPASESARLGPYVGLEPLAEGAFSRVFAARSAVDGRPVVIKLARSPEPASAEAFLQEYERGSGLVHPHLAELLDHGRSPDGRAYMVLAAHEGEPLTSQRGPWPTEAVARLGLQLARALAALHAEGLAHRDLSPANVLLDARGQARLIDFGLLAPSGEAAAGGAGTPLYLAPEVLAGGPADAQSDLYALGALLYRQACGEAPFEDLAADDLLAAALSMPIAPIGERTPQLSPALASLIMRLLSKDRRDRPVSAAEVAESLRRWDGAPFTPGEGQWRPTEAFTAWRELAGLPGVWAFVGEPGLGRSRHLREAFTALRRCGQAAWRCGAEPGDGPFALAERLWRWAVAQVPSGAAALTVSEQACVASLWPWAFPDVTPCDEPDRLPERLNKGLAGLLRAAAGGPLAILIDDWEAADTASRSLFEGLWGEPGFHWLLAGRQGQPGITAWTLGPMAGEDAAAWLDSCWQLTLPAGFKAQLHHLSGGNPGWMRLAIGHLAREGAIAGREWQPTALALPATAEAMLAAQWGGLSGPQRSLAEVLAIYAQPFRPDDLKGCGALLPADWPLVLATLVEAGVLWREGDTHRFSHGWWPGWIGDRLEAERRQALAEGLARVLEAAWGPVSDPGRLHRLATLYEQGAAPEPAIRYALLAGRALARVYANQSALGHFQAGLAAVQAHPEPGRFEGERQALAIGQADVQRLTGELAAAASTYEACLAGELAPAERARLLVSLGKTRQMLNRFEPAREALEAALVQLEPLEAPLERLRALTTLGRVLYFLGERALSIVRYEAALALGRAEGEQAFAAEALAFLGTLRVGRADTVRQGLEELAEALAIREALGDQLGRTDTHMLLGNALYQLGRYQEARCHFEANRAIAAQVGQRQEQGFAHLNLGIVALELGEWPQAAAELAEARRLAGLAGDEFLRGLGAFFESLAHLHLGDMATQAACLSEAREREAAQANATLRLYGLLVEAERHLFLGAFEQARRAAELALGLIAGGTGPENASKAHLLLAEAWLHQGHLPAAGEALADAFAALKAGGAVGPLAHYWRLRGWLCYRQGRPEEARRAWQEGLAIACEQRMAHAEILLRLYGHWLARQDGEDAEELERAYALAEQLRDPELLALGCLGLGARRLEEGQDVYAERLFRRGQELLGLYSQGLSSPEARRAFLAHPARAPYCEVSEIEEAHRLKRRGRRLEMLLELGRAIGRTRDPGQVLAQVRAFTLEVTQAERCLILLVSEAGDWRLFGEPAAYSGTIARRVCESRESACVLDTQSDEGLMAQASIQDLQVRTVMCVPLVVGAQLHGLLYVDSQVALGAFTREDLHHLEAIAKQAAVALDNAKLHQALEEQLRRQADYIRRLEESAHVIRHLEELDRVRGEYFQAASHDLRAPLASISAACQGLSRGLWGPLLPEQAEVVAGIQHGGQSLMGLIDGILDAAKLEAGQLLLNARPVALVKPVREAVRLLSALAAAKGLALRWDEPALAALPPVQGDERRLQQVVLNLLANAIKFTEQGHVTVSARLVAGGVELSVSDTGPGLPPERRERLFERYGASESGAIAGSGLGLWLVKGLVDLHQGRIEVESRRGEGTIFRIVLNALPDTL